MYIKVIVNSDINKQEAWDFWIREGMERGINFVLVLNSYVEYARINARHKFLIINGWYRLDRKSSNIERPEIPQSVIDEAKQQFKTVIDQMKVE